ncbi:MAG: hypothetical protein HRU29_03290 [Rhizobiales bacterium]|nr:hypothetical protein [Hyphomicrobiales bacterium]NRB13403.1 hypothetical protein [Hyphomicrobiales bacterium]
MKNRAFLLLPGLFVSLLLSSCASPIGDFGRIDVAQTKHLTQSRAIIVDHAARVIFFDPLNYSKAEQKLRLTDRLLRNSRYNALLGVVIGKKYMVSYFDDNGIYSVRDRYRSLELELDRFNRTLPEYQILVQKILQQHIKRNNIFNDAVDAKLIKAISFRHQENLDIIHSLASYIQNFYSAYKYVINHSKIVEPDISALDVEFKMAQLSLHLQQLQSAN